MTAAGQVTNTKNGSKITKKPNTYWENNYRYSKGNSHKYSETHNKKKNISTQVSRVGMKQFWFNVSYKGNGILIRHS